MVVKQALTTMLSMQDRMNTRIHENWIRQNFAWYRAVWIECGELIEHYGYKWWKAHEADMRQVQLEVIDIWHFGMSALFREGVAIDALAAEIATELADCAADDAEGLCEATEALAAHALTTRSFSPRLFWPVMLASGLDFEQLYGEYVGKNVLNFFRQDHGYKAGSYSKIWGGREDNEHLVELVSGLDREAQDFAEQVYAALARRYRELVTGL